MKEYKILKPKFKWTNSHGQLEDDLNGYAKQGWQVVNVYVQGQQIYALLERDKNR